MHTMNNEEVSEYCLRWHKHSFNLLECFAALLDNEDLADVSFFVEGKLVPAHKVVLSFCSQYFEILFKEETIDKHPIIILKDVKHQHMRMLLEFMYKGQVNVPQEALNPIMNLAESLCIKGLADGVAKINKIPDPENNLPMSLIHPKNANNYNTVPHTPPHSESKTSRPLPAMYSTSSPSVLSTALTMPSALSLASPLSLPHLASLPPNFASSLASTLTGAMPHSISSFMQPRNLPPGCEFPLVKRRKRHRRRSGETQDSGDSDGRSSGSPGDSVQNLQFPRIPATITPIGLHRQHSQHFQHNSQQQQHVQQQPRDLSIHSSENKISAHTNHHDRPVPFSPHVDRFQAIKLPPNIPGLLHHPSLLENHSKPQDEPENLEHRPQQSIKEENERIPKMEVCNEEPINNQSDSSTQEDKSSPVTSGRRSNEDPVPIRVSPKFSSDHESLSPAKSTAPQSRVEETSSDNHISEDEREESNSGPKDHPNERLSDSTPGPSTSRPQSEEAPPTPNFLGWPYSTDPNSGDEHFTNFSEANHGFWKNSFKGGLLAPYLGSPLGPLPHNPRGLASTFPGLYGTAGTPPTWGRRSNSPPGLGLPTHLRSNECSRCGRLYKTRKGLKHHIKNECGVEPRFQCSHCDWKFKQKAHLLRHMARKHTIS